ncbi:hypothetical protein [Moorena sp. SIO3H5]|uniref:hypothetical protein n=1 Tax=Moorena sp. SIO3H5 TaxID=2607834 RepID=UPI0013B779D2|nr:hypothetical protein [Moorena sp. SIO3H5]NEO68370.1 hypothetical protein [Moorena sp. SIO3H5]
MINNCDQQFGVSYYSVSTTHEVHISFYLFPLPSSLFPLPSSLFPLPSSLLPAPCSLLPKNQKIVPHSS